MKKGIMVIGTGSGSGKSKICCGIGRYLSDLGKSVAPFKSISVMEPQEFMEKKVEKNRNGMLRLSRSCRVTPQIEMNPIQILRQDRSWGDLIINGDYFGKVELLADDTIYTASLSQDTLNLIQTTILTSLSNLQSAFDYIVIEGAGSPTDDIHDIANQYVASLCDYGIVLCARTNRDCLLATVQGIQAQLKSALQQRMLGLVLNSISTPATSGETNFIQRCQSELGLELLATIPVLDAFEEFEDRWNYLSARVAQSPLRHLL